jgi:hypothetical protein
MNAQTGDEARCTLAAQALREQGRLNLRATGLSMLPTLWPGDLLTIHARDFDQVEPGDVVLYSREGRFFIHRVVSRPSEELLLTRGDCAAQDDPAVTAGQVLGVVTEIHRERAVVVPRRRPGVVQRLLAHALCHSDLLVRIVLRWNSVRIPGIDFAPRKAAP